MRDTAQNFRASPCKHGVYCYVRRCKFKHPTGNHLVSPALMWMQTDQEHLDFVHLREQWTLCFRDIESRIYALQKYDDTFRSMIPSVRDVDFYSDRLISLCMLSETSGINYRISNIYNEITRQRNTSRIERNKPKYTELLKRLRAHGQSHVANVAPTNESASEASSYEPTPHAECRVCFDDFREWVFSPCGHLAVCSTCAPNWGPKANLDTQKLCPICREPIEDKVQLQISTKNKETSEVTPYTIQQAFQRGMI